jgi:toxin ParE1/3/4
VFSVEWKSEALDDLATIYVYIEERNPKAARELYEMITQSAEKLPQMPYLFRRGRVNGTREYVVHPNYILIYQVKAQHIEIVRVMHAKQEYPKN